LEKNSGGARSGPPLFWYLQKRIDADFRRNSIKTMLGKGLESLIPKKDNKTPQTFSSGDKDSEREAFSSLARSSPPNLAPLAGPGSASRLAHESFNRSPSVSPQKSLGRQESIFHIEVEKIQPNPYQPRRTFDEESLTELANSIREFGIIQPLVVTKAEKETPTGTEVFYQLIAGERRLMAAKLIGLPRVPVIVKYFDAHRDKLEMALVENIQRSDLNPVEAARAYARLQDEFNLTQREIAAKIGKSRETVVNTVRLLALPGNMQEALVEGRLNESQARLILASADPIKQTELFERFLSGRPAAKIKSEIVKPVDPEAKYWEKRLEEKLGYPVEVQRRGGRGKITVKFNSEAEWQNLLDKVMGNEE